MKLNFINMITLFIIVTTGGILYERYLNKYFPDSELDKYDIIKKYLLNETNNKPIIWVHTDYNINSRKWGNFYSRNNKDLNQEYINLCVETIVKYCGKSFNVFLIDDNAFDRLLPDWDINLNLVSGTVKKNLRLIGQCNLLHKYGGLMIPNSTLIFKDLIKLYNNSLEFNDMFVGEMINNNISNSYIKFIPNTTVMGCKKGSKSMKDLIVYLEELYSKDNSNETIILGNIEKFLYNMVNNNKIQLISGKLLGIKDDDENPILIDNLISNEHIKLTKNVYCIVIDKDMLKSRNKYNWFIKLNKHEILSSDIALSKYILISKGYNIL